jgi:long-chain fatty acid transport protein
VVTLPESVAAGAAFTPIPALTVEAGAVWARWSRYRALELSLPGGGSASYPKNWKDAWRVTMGLEYAALSWLDLRGGYNYTESPMTARDADYGVPTDGRHTFTVGLGVHDDRMSLDLGYIFVHCRSRSYVDSPIATGGSGTVESAGRGVLANQLAMSFTYKL